MNVYEAKPLSAAVSADPYVGRGIILGKTPSGKYAVSAYFIMGRSANSRNRIFSKKDGVVLTEPFDASKVEDPSLIIYNALRVYENKLIVTNGDQTDTVYDGLVAGKSFEVALESRSFEPDAPNFTPRISGMITFDGGDFTYQMSILKSADEIGSACSRYTFSYPALSGIGHFIHTYVGNGTPLPTFQGEPERVAICEDMNELADTVWQALDQENKISLYVRYTSLSDGSYTDCLYNKNK